MIRERKSVWEPGEKEEERKPVLRRQIDEEEEEEENSCQLCPSLSVIFSPSTFVCLSGAFSDARFTNQQMTRNSKETSSL